MILNSRIYKGITLGLLFLLTAVVAFSLGVEFAPSLAANGSQENGIVIVTQPTTTQSTSAVEEPVAELGTVPLNTATVEEIMTVPGIGETFAKRIVAYREQVGEFTALEQLMQIEGVGKTRYKKWAPYFTLN